MFDKQENCQYPKTELTSTHNIFTIHSLIAAFPLHGYGMKQEADTSIKEKWHNDHRFLKPYFWAKTGHILQCSKLTTVTVMNFCNNYWWDYTQHTCNPSPAEKNAWQRWLSVLIKPQNSSSMKIYINIIYLHTNIKLEWGRIWGITCDTVAQHTSYTSSWWKCGTSKSKRHLVASWRSPEDKYSCRSNVIWRVRYFTGRSPPPTPHTLSSRTNPCFIDRSVSARDRACLHHRNTELPCHALQFPDL